MTQYLATDAATPIALEPRDQIGANGAPAPTPFDLYKEHIEDLYLEAMNWLDGVAIESAPQAAEVQTLLRMIERAAKDADAQRVLENAAFDAGKAEVQARYAPLIGDTKAGKGKTVLAAAGCRAALSVWLRKLQAEKDAEAEIARVAAEQAAQAAAQAARAAHATGDLGALEAAEALIQEARVVAKFAGKAGGDVRADGMGRAATLRDHWTIRGFAQGFTLDGEPIDSESVLLRHYWHVNRAPLVACALELAAADVRAGAHSLPGLIIENEPRV